MKPNRSIPPSTVVPVLVYPDVRAAVAWLHDAFGFRESVRIGEDHRAQLKVGDGAVIVRDVRGARRPPDADGASHSVMVRVDDASAHCARAREHGARILMEPTDFAYGERQYEAADPAGHRWTFSETLADVAPEDWGGTTVGGR
ncbi:glyoxalase [Baekduia soli]|uniref:Glyoxalase n=1 Tax=Baekduia soli TaxID=496014 RepID=A0A5B8U8P8_9ACTN|nr:VOC family protein [Baekduia soli]QEC49503.1 glyoxalase [Baekduia soli]